MDKKIIKICFILILIIIITCLICVSFIFFDTMRTHIIEIDLTQITEEERNKLIDYNFLDLQNYPKSINFISLIMKSEIRETQFFISFSVAKNENIYYKIERDKTNISGESSIFKISEDDEKIIYEFETNFTLNSKENKWSFL